MLVVTGREARDFRAMINQWFEERVHCFETPAREVQPQPTDLLPAGPGDRFQHCSQVSASEPDRLLQPILGEDPDDGSFTFMLRSNEDAQSEARKHVRGEQRESHARVRNSVRESRSLVEEKESLLELVKDIASHLDVLTLCHRILLHVNHVLTADRCSLFIVRCDAAHERHLVSRLFDVSPGSTPEQTRNMGLRLPWGKGIVGHVAASGCPVNVANAYKDQRFNVEVDLMTGYKTQSVLCLPLKDYKGEIVGVAQAINKKGEHGGQFTAKDETDFSAYLAFCGIVLHNAKLHEKCLMENRHNQILLELASLVCEEQHSLSQLVSRILSIILSFLPCQRCSVFISAPDAPASFCDVFHKNLEDLRETSETSKSEGEIPVNYIYAEFVAWSLTLLNIPDAYCDDRFDPPNEDGMECKTNSLLCAPICNRKKDTVIGVCQLVNKLEEGTNEVVAFNQNDEQFVVAFALFCGMAIHNTRMFEMVSKAVAKQAVTLEVLSYHMMAREEEIKPLQILPVPSMETLDLLSFDFNGFEMQDEQAMMACLGMFNDLSLLQAFQITHQGHEILQRLSVEDYHTAIGMIKHAILSTDLVVYHQLYKIAAEVAELVSHQAIAEPAITESLPRSCRVIAGSSPCHRHLASTVFFRTCGEFLDLVNSASLDTSNMHHRRLLRGMLMTSCDIAAITKPWPVQKKIAELVVQEFFALGDKEKEEFNTDPIDILNREKKHRIPAHQVNFIDSLCLPLYKALYSLSPACKPLMQGCQKNRRYWQLLDKQQSDPQQNSSESSYRSSHDMDPKT
uniref:3',5'-cyclic-GMP phosphodiesterase n=1 Tax=Eptatretus burgeri TaxID=7764 RepID=A0A8C4R9Z5_EPTBU